VTSWKGLGEGAWATEEEVREVGGGVRRADREALWETRGTEGTGYAELKRQERKYRFRNQHYDYVVAKYQAGVKWQEYLGYLRVKEMWERSIGIAAENTLEEDVYEIELRKIKAENLRWDKLREKYIGEWRERVVKLGLRVEGA